MAKLRRKQLFIARTSGFSKPCKSQNTYHKVANLTWKEARNYSLEAMMISKIGSLEPVKIPKLEKLRYPHLSSSLVAGLVAIGLVGLFIIGFSWLIGGKL